MRKNILLVLLSICTGLALCEWMLSVLDLPRFYTSRLSSVQFRYTKTDDDVYYYTNFPSSKIRLQYDANTRGYFNEDNTVYHTTNSWGFRGPEFTVGKPESTYRIAVIGDSFTFGEGVKDNHVYAKKVEQLLNDKFKEKQHISFEAYNFGVSGYNTEQSLFLLNNVALKTNPNIVIYGYVLNDSEPPLFSVDASGTYVTQRPRLLPENQSDPRPPETFAHSFRTVKLFWKSSTMKRLNKKTVEHYNGLYEQNGPHWQRTRQCLRALIKTCETKNIDCYILCFPILYKLDNGYPFENIHALLRSEIAAMNSSRVHFIDLLDYLRGHKYTTLWVHPTDQHPNEVVHDIAAKAVVRKISENLRLDSQQIHTDKSQRPITHT